MPSLDRVKEARNSSNEQEDMEVVHKNILNVFENTLLVLVSKDLYKLQILKEMAVWMSKDKAYLQERVLVIISRVLSFASRKVKTCTSVDASCLGDLAAELSLLCSHFDPAITQQASLGMYHLLCIAKCQTDFKHVGQNLTPSLLTDFVWSLLMKLSDAKYKTVSEAAALLELTLEYHADKVTMVSKIVDTIYKKLCGHCTYKMKQAMLRVITLLTRTSPKKIIFQLMEYPVPADNNLLLMWHAAGSEASVAPHVLKTLLLILKGKPGERHDCSTSRRRLSLDASNMMPVAASQALCTLLPVSSYKKAVAEFFPQLLVALLLQIYYSCDLRLSSHNCCFARDALRILLKCSGLQEVDYSLQKNNFWDQFSQVLFHHHGVYVLAKTLSDYQFPQFPETLHYLYKLSVEDPRRSEDSIVTVIFFTELLNNFFRDPFPEEFLVLFRNWVTDENPSVSKMSLQKIASMAPVVNEIENVHDLILSVLNAFLSKDTTVIIRALITLRKLLGKLDTVTYASLCTKIASSYCPLMDHKDVGIRTMAIRHFGGLLQDMHQYTSMLNDVVLEGLVPLILFLEDTELEVVRACKYALDVCATQLNWPTPYWLKDTHYNFEIVVLNIWYLAKLCGHLLLTVEIEAMFDAVHRTLRDEDPLVRELSVTTEKIFKEIGYGLTSSSIKQAFRRLFSFLYFKKLKLLYHYTGVDTLPSKTELVKYAKNSKEDLQDENFEDFE
ncbi:maestro heat-like repeat-containing protein family member 9 [Rhynchocyon petersi]